MFAKVTSKYGFEKSITQNQCLNFVCDSYFVYGGSVSSSLCLLLEMPTAGDK